MRERAVKLGIVKQLPDDVPETEGKTVVAVDGSATVERMAGTDVYAAAAVRVAGYGADIDPKPPDYQVEVHPAEGVPDGSRVNLALMGLLECKLVNESNADLVLLDGTIFTMVLNAGIGMTSASDKHDELSKSLKSCWYGYARDAIPELLVSECVASIPKRSTAANEFERDKELFYGKDADLTGIMTASLILGDGEYTDPLPLPTERLYLGTTSMTRKYRRDLNQLLQKIRVVYFRPHAWSPAYRVEFAPSVAEDTGLLERQLALIREQCVNPAMREPYPSYLADRFVRSLSKGMAAVVEAVRGRVTSQSDVDVELAHRFLNYTRSEPYRELEPE